MNSDDLPERWKIRLQEWLKKFGRDGQDGLSSNDFPGMEYVELRFEDDSFARFEYALVIEEPIFREIGVFTEHCGYHIFPLGGTHVAKIEKSWSE